MPSCFVQSGNPVLHLALTSEFLSERMVLGASTVLAASHGDGRALPPAAAARIQTATATCSCLPPQFPIRLRYMLQ